MPDDAQKPDNYVGGQHRSAINRHAARRADVCAKFLYPYLDKLAPDFKFLDIGCGPGSITTDLAARYPAASFLGIDSGEAQVAHARDLAHERGLANVEFRVGDLMDPGLDLGGRNDDGKEGGSSIDGGQEVSSSSTGHGWGSFDAVYCHQVLGHAQAPAAALRVMGRAAKAAGGLVAARESSRRGQFFEPSTPATEAFLDAIFEMMRRNGSTPDVGLKLVALAMDAGWARDRIDSSVSGDTFHTPAERAAWADNVLDSLRDRDSATRRKLAHFSMADDSTVGAWIEGWRAWHADAAAWGCSVSGEIVCRN